LLKFFKLSLIYLMAVPPSTLARKSVNDLFYLRIEQYEVEGYPYESIDLTSAISPSELIEVAKNGTACMIKRLSAILDCSQREAIHAQHDPETGCYRLKSYQICSDCDAVAEALDPEWLCSASPLLTIWEFPRSSRLAAIPSRREQAQ
jgi:hypothetical protein